MNQALKLRVWRALRAAETILENMAKEQPPALFRSRWAVPDEPLRNDAQRLLPLLHDVANLVETDVLDKAVAPTSWREDLGTQANLGTGINP